MKTFALIVCVYLFKMAAGQVERYDLVINEIMADPSPIVGLPNAEYIELKNVSGRTIDLLRFKIDNGTTASTISSSYLLPSDSMVVLCSRTQTIFFHSIRTIGLTSFPALNNDGDLVTLKSPDGKTIHAVEYKSKWYRNPVKANGGWSLEMIDPLQPCATHNWTASTDSKGGTPGRENSIMKPGTSHPATQALQCIALASDKLLLILDQGVDSLSAFSSSRYTFNSADIQVTQTRILPPLFREIELMLNKKMEEEKIYTLSIGGLQRCRSATKDSFAIRTGIPKEPETGDLVINEILFNPPSDGADFLEIRNNSTKVINAKGLYLSSRNDQGIMGIPFIISDEHFNIFPDEAIAITTDSGFVLRQWKSSRKKSLLETSAMPSMPDDKGNVMLLNTKGKILDEIRYNDDMHFPLLRDISGVSLERIDPYQKTNSSQNWHSASSNTGYATPGQENSQFRKNDSSIAAIQISPEVVSPNNDGHNDMLQIQYRSQLNGCLLNVYLFAENGQFIMKLVDNQLCGMEGSFYWDGLKRDTKLQDGFYIILAELMPLNEKPFRYKKLIGIRSG
jgi:hypothetical protein